ncbi:Ribosomal protein S9 [Trinorchestia longiramus]|nr:Ribosomal protein S9 [Trinorchestia longiramus]
MSGFGLKVGEDKLSYLLFADDIVVVDQRGASSYARILKQGQQEQMLEKVRNSVDQETMAVITPNKAAKSYLERVQAQRKFLSEKVTEFELGRRHLANIMGLDPATVTQQEINEAIEYLFPSTLTEPKARPHMLPPEEVFTQQKGAQFDITGRPYHSLFYTIRPKYYQTMHDLAGHMIRLNKHEDKVLRTGASVEIVDRFVLEGSRWMTKEELEGKLLEKLHDWMFEKLILSLERLCQHRYAFLAKDFIMQFREPIHLVHEAIVIPEIQTDENGRRFAIAQGTRKTSKALVKVLEGGTGLININGSSLLYFKYLQEREQVLLPLQVCELLDKVDVFCTVEIGGTTGQACAIRYALSQALSAFVDPLTREKMRLVGLLTQDVRRHERKKPGQKGARAKYTWRKR